MCSKKQGRLAAPPGVVAEWTGLEPATSGVTGQHSNQLNYHSAFEPLSRNATRDFGLAWKSALDRAGLRMNRDKKSMVGAEGFEPPTLAV